MSLAILIVLVLGILGGMFMPEVLSSFLDQASSVMLLILLFSVGIDLGLNRQAFVQIRQMGFRILLIPFGGTVSFLSNVFREMITFIFVPFIVKYLNSYCAIAPAGATAMDTTLGIISKHTDGKTAVIAFVSGVICTLVVPILVPLFL